MIFHFFDSGNAGYYDENANDASYISIFRIVCIAGDSMMVVDKTERNAGGKIMVMYTESLAITSGMYTLGAGAIDRSRPLVYGGEEVPMEKNVSNNSQRSFYAGHTAASACA